MNQLTHVNHNQFTLGAEPSGRSGLHVDADASPVSGRLVDGGRGRDGHFSGGVVKRERLDDGLRLRVH